MLALLLSGLLVIAAAFAVPGVMGEIEEKVAAWAWRAGATRVPERRVVIIDIDNDSVARFGPWPWPRERLAELSERLAAEGVAAQVFDIVFPEAAPGDERFAAALRDNGGVLSQVFSLDPSHRVASGSLQGALDGMACGAPFPVATGHIANTPALPLPAGHITPLLGPGGAVQRTPAIICQQGKGYPALAIAGFMAAADLEPRVEPGRGFLAPPWQLSFKDLPGIGIPLDDEGAIRLPYHLHPDAMTAVSAGDVLAGRVPDGMLRGVWAIIGGTAFGIQDAVPTPFGSAVAGVSVHAQLLPALLDNRVPVTPARGALLQSTLAALGALVLLSVATWSRTPPAWLPLMGVALAALFALAAAALLLQLGLWVGWSHAALFCLALSLALTVAAYARLRRERGLLHANLASYLPAAVAGNLALRAPEDGLRAERRDCVALYADLRNFSMYCEAGPPEAAAAILHAFFSAADRIIEQHGGRLENLQGDAILAVWPDTGNGESALAAARDLLADARHWLPDMVAPGVEPLAMGIGIEVGPVLAGFFGGARRRAYAALGEAVTVAQRLQGLTLDLAEPILLGPRVAATLDPGVLVDRGEFLLEGLARTRRVFACPAEVAA